MTQANNSSESGRKLFIGPRFRRLRQQLGLTQTEIASELGVSPSYVNLIERNQRPVTAQVLLRLAEAFELDLKDLASGNEEQAFAELNEVFSDPLFRGIDLPKQEVQDLTHSSPGITHALQRLYGAYVEARRGETLVASRIAEREGDGQYRASPIDRVREIIEANRNHFPDIETAAEAVRAELDEKGAGLLAALDARLRERHAIRLRVLPVEAMPNLLRRFDRHRRQLLVSELVEDSGRLFQAAYQIGLEEHGALFERLADAANEKDPETRRHLRVNFANYFAAAVMMPYRPFQESAEQLAYDIAVLGRRFAASFEQVCHRLTTLQRPAARGVPFFMLRVDHAGNVSKRFSSGTFPFSRFGGTCPLWNVHTCFDTPGQIVSQLVELPDGQMYFSVARTVKRAIMPHAQVEPRHAIALGCDVKFAPRLVYAAGRTLTRAEATPIGVNCRLCERADCAQRAEPPITRVSAIDESIRGVSPFPFLNAGEI
jgi:predicted transcriptional regulator/transcriptional regulator with XRE-family HTH domain